jgi:hypothetical protein
MPTLRFGSYTFRFYSSDGVEPPHIHVLRDNNEAKVWLQPIAVSHNRGYTQREVGEILRLVAEHLDRLLEAWDGYFSDFGG